MSLQTHILQQDNLLSDHKLQQGNLLQAANIFLQHEQAIGCLLIIKQLQGNLLWCTNISLQ